MYKALDHDSVFVRQQENQNLSSAYLVLQFLILAGPAFQRTRPLYLSLASSFDMV